MHPTFLKITIGFLCSLVWGVSLANKPSGLITREFGYGSQQIDLPAVGIESQVEVGESIVSKVRSTRRQAIKFKSPISGSVSILFFSYQIKFSSTTIPLYGRVSNGAIYANPTDSVPEGGGAFAGVFVPSNPSDPHYLCSVSPTVAISCAQVAIKPDESYSFTEIEELSSDSFKRELVYTGGNSKSITIIYREFKNDFARPAFTQELKYDISEDPVIGYKGARFEVIKAGNSGLTYKVMRPLQ